VDPVSLRRVHRCWEHLADTDPLWGILSDPDKKGNRWQIDEFFRTGEEQVASLLAELDELGHSPDRGKTLDFGCGVGRLTQALAARFGEVHGVDISSRMVEMARQYNRHGSRCLYHASEAERLLFDDASFDFVLSLITLQHIPARLSRGYVREFLRVLRPGGMAVFQLAAEPLPTAGSGGLREAVKRALPRPVLAWIRDRRAGMRGTTQFEMHGIPRPEVERLIRDGSGQILRAVKDRDAGEGWTSFRYTVSGGVLRGTPSPGR